MPIKVADVSQVGATSNLYPGTAGTAIELIRVATGRVGSWNIKFAAEDPVQFYRLLGNGELFHKAPDSGIVSPDIDWASVFHGATASEVDPAAVPCGMVG